MKVFALIIVIISFSKLCIAVSQEKQEFANDLFYQLRDNLEVFQKKAMLILIVDGFIGLICGLLLWL